LLERLAGLPLALAQAGSFMRTTRMSITQYLNLYDNSRRQLLESHRPLFGRGEDCSRGSVWTTWSMSVSLLRDMAQRPGSGNLYRNALKLLRLITYFEPTDIDFAILRRGLICNDVPQWFEDVCRNELSFVTTAEILVQRSLLNGTAKYATYSMHRVVYDWLCASDENDLDEQLLGLAMCAIAFSAPGRQYRSWKEDEKRLIVHALAMEDKLLRCQFTSGVPMIDLGTFTFTQRQRALLLVRDTEWYKELDNTLQPLTALTYLFSVFGKTQTGIQIIDTALAKGSQGNGIKDTHTCVALLQSKALILYHEESFKAARSCLQSAINLARQHNLQDGFRDINILNALITRKEGNLRLAIQMLSRLLLDCQRLGLALYHPSTFSTVVVLDFILQTERKKDDTTFNSVKERIRLLEPYRVDAEERAFQDDRARFLLACLGSAYCEADAMGDAKAVLKIGLAAELANGPDNTENLAEFYYQLCRTCRKIDPLHAVEYCEKWLQVRMERYGTNSKQAAEALSDLCRMRQDAQPGDTRALQVGLQAAEIFRPDDGKEYWRICQRLCDVYNAVKNWEEATAWGLRAVESSASQFGTRSREHALELNNQGKIYEKAGDLESARVYFQMYAECSKPIRK
jgi:tetratricopeptide (TPR) repeat protein